MARHRLADADLDRAAEMATELADEQRQADSQAVAADPVKQGGVLAAEMDGEDVRVDALDEAGGKLLPGQVLGPAKDIVGRGDAAGRKDQDGDATPQQPPSLGTAADVRLHGLPGTGEVDREGERAHLGHAQEIVRDQNAIRPADTLGERQEGDAVGDAEGMVGDHDEGLVGHRRRPSDGCLDLKLGVDAPQRLVPHQRVFASHLLAPLVVERQQLLPARQVLDAAHKDPLAQRVR